MDTDNENKVVPQSKEELPQWAKDELSEARSEAAKYRTQKNEAVEAAKKAVSEGFELKIQELQAAVTAKEDEISSARDEVSRLTAALEAGIPTDKVQSFAGILKGSNLDEFRSHAEELKKLFVVNDKNSSSSKAYDPSQGHQSNHVPLNGDPLLRSLERALHIK